VVFINGLESGQITPHTFAGLDRNLYVVSVRLPDHVATPGSIPVDLGPQQDVTLDFALSQTGLLVTSRPSGAAIFLNGADSGLVTPAQVGGLDPGVVEVSLRLGTYLVIPVSLPVTVVAGQVDTVPVEAFSLVPQRTVVLEGFANINCIPCPQLTTSLLDFAAQPGHGTDRVIFIEYAVNWPNLADPFYTHNPLENADRFDAYAVPGAPSLFVDGVKLRDALDTAVMADEVEAGLQVDPGFRVAVAADFTNPTVAGQVTLTADQTVDLTGYSLFVALYEEKVDFHERGLTPGTNGQYIFHHTFRDRMDARPALGPLAPGTPVVFALSLARGDWPLDNLVVVAFVQHDRNLKIVQAGSVAGPASAQGLPR
jgi:hypothetical protein